MPRLELVRREEVLADFPLRGVKLTLGLPHLTPDGRSALKPDGLDAELVERPNGHHFILREAPPSAPKASGADDGAEEGKVMYEHACCFVVDVDATRVKVKRNKGNPLIVVELTEARGALMCTSSPLDVPPDAPLELRAEAAAVLVASQLAERLYAVIDSFLPRDSHTRLAAWARELRRAGGMRPGEVEGGRLARVRGDLVAWVDPFGDGDEHGSPPEPLQAHATQLDEMMMLVMTDPKLAADLANRPIMRDRAMVTCYPGAKDGTAGEGDGDGAGSVVTSLEEATGAGYARHSDAAHGKNMERVLTCILYLNDDWDHARDGGCLRVWPKTDVNARCHVEALERWRRSLEEVDEGGRGAGRDVDAVRESLEPAVDIAPVGNRLVVFWSDTRCPHAVRPVNPRLGCGEGRYAVSFWYYDQELLAAGERSNAVR